MNFNDLSGRLRNDLAANGITTHEELMSAPESAFVNSDRFLKSDLRDLVLYLRGKLGATATQSAAND